MKWFRFYSEALHDPKVQKLPAPLFRHWVNLLCLANTAKTRGVLPAAADVAYGLRVSTEKASSIVAELAARGLMDQGENGSLRPHGWEARQFASDNVSERVRRFRKRDGNVTKPLHETPPEQIQKQKQNRADTETEQSTTSSAALVTLSVRCKENLEAFTKSDTSDLKDWIELTPEDRAEEIITYALKEAALHNVLKWRYVQSILLRLEEAGWPADLGSE